MLTFLFEEPLDTSLSHPSSSHSQLSAPQPQKPHTSQWTADRKTDEMSTYTNGQDLSREKSTMRPAGSMSISSLLGRDDVPPAPQLRGSKPEYKRSYVKSSSTDHTHPYLPNALSSTTQPDNIYNRRTHTPDGVKYNLAISSKRKQPQPATSPTTINANGRASTWDATRSYGSARQSYSPSVPNASIQSSLNKENRIETHRTESPISMRQLREPLQSPLPFNEREEQVHSIHRRPNHEHASLSGNQGRVEPEQSFHGRVENGLDTVESRSRSLLDLSDGQRYEAQSLKMNQENGTDYWIAPKRANGDSFNLTAKNEFYERNVPTLRAQTIHTVLNATSVSHNGGDHDGSLKRERSSVDSQIQAQSNDSNNFLRRSEAPWLSAGSARGNHRSRNNFSDGASRRLEELPHHKVLAGITSENNKRTGRASPLPQAVQGAQARTAGPGGHPGIKNEFGRMFSGLGSGLSSAPPNNGITSPRLSPLPQRPHDGVESAPPHSNVNVESLKLTRTGSYPGGKIRRMKEDDVFPNGNDNGRSSPLGALEQGVKRNKNTHPSHHHHHPPLSHQ